MARDKLTRSFGSWNLARVACAGVVVLAIASSARGQTTATEDITFDPIGDAYVESSSPTTNFNADELLRVDSSPRRIAYLRFAVTGIGARRVIRARLRLSATDPSDDGGTVYSIGNGTWTEAQVTYNSRPPLNGPAVGTIGPVIAGAVLDVDLGTAITGDGVYDLAIQNASDDGAFYHASTAPTAQRPVLRVTVEAGPRPSIGIIQPLDGASFFVGDTITLQGVASDINDGNLGAAIVWTSSLDGALGAGAIAQPRLRVGTHVLIASVSDRDLNKASAQITLTVMPPPGTNSPPLVAITEPIDGRAFTAGRPILFAATAFDLEQGDLTPNLVWTSDLDGTLGSGGSFVHPLREGVHKITVAVTDAGGLIGSDAAFAYVVGAPGFEFSPTADTYVDAGDASENFGTEDVLMTDANTQRITYLRFAVSGVGTQGVARAILRLHVDTASGAESNSGGTLRTITNSTWQEQTVTFANRPAVDGTTIGTQGAVARGQVVEFDASAVVTRDGAYNFAIVSASSDGAEYGSRESATPPRLIVELRGRAPLLSISSPANQAIFFLGAPITLGASALDFDDGDLGGAIAWRSNLDGSLGMGRFVTTTRLRAGTHVLTASVTDSDAITSQAQRTIRVRLPNAAPQLTLVSPAPGTALPGGSLVDLRATASDDFDGDVSSRIQWTSSLSGALGTGPTLKPKLAEGTHTLTASVVDSDGAPASATTSVTMLPSPPVVTITAPAKGATLVAGSRATFTASALDATDGDVSAKLRWTSDRTGQIGTGRTFQAALTAGIHVVTASVSDAGGLTGQAQHAVVVVNGSGQIGFKDLSFGSSVDEDDNRITAAKPESKVWFHDKRWWATLYAPAAKSYRIHRLDMRTQVWIDTGTQVDERPRSRQDALVDGDRLYIASRFAGSKAQNRLLRYTYSPTTRTYTLDTGFPVNISGAGTEALTLAKDSTGRLWIAYTLKKKVYVNRTTGDDRTWGKAFVLPVSQGTSVASDDICAITTLQGSIGVFWGNQSTDAFYLAVHPDTAAPNASWKLEIPVRGGAVADDHFNLKVASDGRLFVAVKTSHTASNAILIGMLIRSPAGVWSSLLPVSSVAVHATRPQCVLDEVRHQLYVFYSPDKSGVYYKVTDMDRVAFPGGDGVRFIDSSASNDINNPTTTKQNVTPQMGVVVLASSPKSTSYFHNTILPDPFPGD
jgi:hypothetical protein